MAQTGTSQSLFSELVSVNKSILRGIREQNRILKSIGATQGASYFMIADYGTGAQSTTLGTLTTQ